MSKRYRTSYQKIKDFLEETVSLIIVHASSEWDWHSVSREPIQNLIDLQGFADSIYEFTANHQSFLKHNGIYIDNNKSPGDYHIENLIGKNYVLVGGKLGECHKIAFDSLLCSGSTREIRIHLPSFAIYDQYEDDDGITLSKIVSSRDPKFNFYEKSLKSMSYGLGYEIYIDDRKRFFESEGKKQLRIWSEPEKMLNYFQK
ncbi:MAG: hypothetical protein ACOCUU_01785 [Nanoarchaeota archaeon]